MNLEIKELNERQKEAVFTNSKKTLVMSGAGAGKTKVLTNRIAYLLSQGVSENEIVAFTFTNKAAREMRTRLNKLLGYETAAFIGTFHSFCYNSIRQPENYYKLGFNSTPEIITDYEKSKIIKDILLNYNKDYSNIPFVSAISKIKNGVKNNDINGEDLLILNAVFKEYQMKLKESSLIDFDDMVPLYLELLKKDNDYSYYCSQYKYVLVDECQDTNQIQYDLINQVSKEYQNIFMVGDEDQLIYSFRSSNISILKDFEMRADKIIILNENYRCNKEILKVANKVISYNSNRLEKDLISNINSDMKVIYKSFINQTDEAAEVALRIKQLHLKGESYDNIAVLYRNNSQASAIEKMLAKEKIPYTIYGGMAFFEYADIKTIIYLYRLLYNPRNLVAFEAIYNKPSPRFEWHQMKPVIENYRNQNDDIITYLLRQTNPKLKELGETYNTLKNLIEEISPEDFFMKVLSYLKYSKYLKESQNVKPEFQRLMTLKDMLKDLTKEEVKELFNTLVLENKDFIKPQGVSLMTIHKSKGLEFNTVFVIGCNDGILPGFSKKTNDVEEDRRVFYVAITRAKQNLFLYSSHIHYINGQQLKLKPSQFLVEAGIDNSSIMDFFGNYWYNI